MENELVVKIGLEVHVSLTTNTKLFCSCSTKWQGKEPNTNCCPTCLGMPGSKPRMNQKAVDCGIKIGIALGSDVSKEMYFSRKSYFYPDMSKNFQITQYEIPICTQGSLRIGEKKIRLRRIQLEEDPARLVHSSGSIDSSQYVLIDYNRSGVPLCEIVTEPDFENPREARLFLQKLSSILEYLGIYDSTMEGSMRVDANVSIKGGERVEVKNISGFKEVEKALAFEIIRQSNLLKRGKTINQETRGFEPASGTTILQRTKEFEEEYGYIFEPDLTRIEIGTMKVETVRKTIPELPDEKLKRYGKIIVEELAESIVTDLQLAEMFEECIKEIDPKIAATWFGNVLKKILNYHNLRMKDTSITKDQMMRFLKSVEKKEITNTTGEMILREMVKPKESGIALNLDDISRIEDDTDLRKFVKSALGKNPKALEDLKSGKTEALQFLVGQVMRESKGRADPNLARKILEEISQQ
jgi:aspartyl-tRNA(Asn)/glutamyl-tRNA(Gln) amidotransferase subunit B